jgi:hypothetical protein
MENNKNDSSKSMLQSNDPQSDGATDIGPTSGEGTSTRNIKMLHVSYSDLDSGCLGPLKKEIGTIINNQKIKCCEGINFRLNLFLSIWSAINSSKLICAY